MKFVGQIFVMFLLSAIVRTGGQNDLEELNEIFKESQYDALHVLSAQTGSELSYNDRELGKFTTVAKDGRNFLRFQFSDILRMPEIHFESRVELQDSSEYLDNLKTAAKEMEKLIVTNPYYRHKFPILGVKQMNKSALNYFKQKFSVLKNAQDEHVKLECQTREIRTDFFHSLCLDEASNNKQMIEVIASLKHAKYCHMIIRTKLQDFSFLASVYIPADEFQKNLEKIFVQISESKIHDEIQLEEIWNLLEDETSKLDPDCMLIGEQDDLAPNLIFGQIINEQYANDYFQDDNEDANDEDNIKKTKKIRRKLSKKNKQQVQYTVRKNNFLEDFSLVQKTRKLSQKRKLAVEKDGECDYEGVLIEINYYNLKLFNYVHLRFAQDSEHTAGHIISKTDKKQAKESIIMEFEQFASDLDRVRESHQKIMSTEKDPNKKDEVYEVKDFEDLISEAFPNIKKDKTSHGMVFKLHQNNLIEIKKKEGEFQIIFYASNYKHQHKHHKKVYMVQTISRQKDNEHIQFFKNSLRDFEKWVEKNE